MPPSRHSPQAAATDVRPLTGHDHAPCRVLIVDDHAGFREAARRLLEARGYAVVGEADDATSALDAVARLEPQGVLLDVCLGEDDGFGVAGALARTAAAPAVVLASVHDCSGARVRGSGACGFVLKTRLAAADLTQFWPAQG
jgi:DNA-binding NarL/FixJ family response regulator